MIDFFSYTASSLNDELFYIRDDQKTEPVRLIFDSNEAKRYNCVIVVNDAKETVQFIPVDNKIPLKRDDASDDEICDVLLSTEKRLTFIEIKDKRDSWISKARKQIESTIIHFDENHKAEKRKRQAFLSNVGKNLEYRYGILASSNKELKDTFLSNYRARIYISNDVYV